MTSIGVAFQAESKGSLTLMYIGRLIAGFGVGAASMLTPLYVSECAPRAIRGGLTGEEMKRYSRETGTDVLNRFLPTFHCYRDNDLVLVSGCIWFLLEQIGRKTEAMV